MNEKQKINILSAKDLEISYSKGSGPGGQAKNKTSSKVTIVHKASGAVASCSESRGQQENKEQAFLNLVKTPKFKVWLNKKLYEIQNEESMEAAVERSMSPENLRIEVKNEEGKWVIDDSLNFNV